MQNTPHKDSKNTGAIVVNGAEEFLIDAIIDQRKNGRDCVKPLKSDGVYLTIFEKSKGIRFHQENMKLLNSYLLTSNSLNLKLSKKMLN